MTISQPSWLFWAWEPVKQALWVGHLSFHRISTAAKYSILGLHWQADGDQSDADALRLRHFGYKPVTKLKAM